MTDRTEIARVAAGLTRAQREAVVRGAGFSRTVSAVWNMRPRLFGYASWSSGEGVLAKPTERGLAVRDHILREKSGG